MLRIGRRDRRGPVSPGWPLLIASCRECRRLQSLAADRVDLTDDGAQHRCKFCDVAFSVRWDDAIALGIVEDRFQPLN
jgi:hypothetical protein